jgi:hypothetical protein
MTSRILHWLCIAAICSVHIPVTVSAQNAQSQSLQEELEVLSDISRDLADVVAEDGDLIENLLDQTNRRADALAAFVGAGVAYVPYTGVLRGAAGTLRSGVGNSYDQSLTLMTVIKRAGYEGQVLVGPLADLPHPDAPFSVTQTALIYPDRAEELAELTQEVAEIAGQISALSGIEPQPVLQSSTQASLDTQVATVAADQAIALLGLTAKPAPAEDAALYAIVRYRETPTQPWIVFDPARNLALGDVDITNFSVLNDNVPTEHTHQVTLTIAVQSEAFGSTIIEERAITVANLNTTPIAIGIAPSGTVLSGDSAQGFAPDQSLVVMSDFFESTVVTLEGQAVSLEAAASSMGAVFQTGAGLLGDAVATLDTGAPIEAPVFDRLILNISTSGPGQTASRTATRVLLDTATVKDALAAGLEIESSDPLRSAMLAAGSATYMIYAGTSPLAAPEADAQSVVALSQMLEGLIAQNPNGHTRSLDDISLHLSDIVAGIFADDAARNVFHTAPSVVVLQTTNAATQSVGMTQVGLRSDVILDGRFGSDPADTLALAVQAAEIEARIMAQLTEALEYDPVAASSYAALTEALSAKTTPVLAQSYLTSLEGLPETSQGALQKAFLAAEIDNGTQIVVWPSDDLSKTVWLEYDPVTGESRLASGNGGGQTATEELLLNINIALYLTVVNLTSCAANASTAAPGQTQKCLTCASAKFGLAVFGMGAVSFATVAKLGAISIGAEALCL